MLTMLAVVLLAQTVPPMGDQQVRDLLEKGQELESRTDGDLNGDGSIDTVVIGRSEEKRTLTMMLAVKGEVDLGHDPAGRLDLDTFPLGPASVKIARGVLTVEDLTGGTTATNAIYRYRLVPGPNPKMRLIGMDVTLYSRTYAHDGFEMSWNLLTGDLITRNMRLNRTDKGDAAYDKITEKKVKRASKPLYMETTPNPDELLESVRG